VYVRDVAKANVLALETEVPNGAYNVGTGVETSVNELYDRMCQLSGKNLLPQSGPQLPGEQRRSCVDPSRTVRALNWWPEVDLDTGLKESLHFFAAL
jgi:UDP-glucose 4-epimerase